ncbi:telomere repeats-binding bouquet formation protein 1-like [Protopterus annectens]|uniref:telomere repeats-binding bouquet formation protein 1-like n=1 Tax=Protopterus annectens TaxID=7888 RepID=UPI001CFAB6C9|nr:telomere repeats-binding bouquet formation protein 1-like [Protopterus annectens]
MDNPEAQKQALSTVHSICQQNDEASDYFRETGGLMFVTVLAKTTPYSPVKEAALFTLGSLAESSVFCQQALCTFELFSEVGTYLSVENSSLKLKRMAVYILLVLVANNKVGQSYVRESGCLDILLSLFRTAFPVSQEKELHAVNQYYHLWSSVCGTLCACVNNPQNDENQKICMTAFPFAKDCLQMFSRSVILRPVCSFVSLTLAGNSDMRGILTETISKQS